MNGKMGTATEVGAANISGNAIKFFTISGCGILRHPRTSQTQRSDNPCSYAAQCPVSEAAITIRCGDAETLQYLHSIYTIYTQYQHYKYKVSTHHLQNIYTVSRQ